MRSGYCITIALALLLVPFRAYAFNEKDVADCSQIVEPDREIEGCTRLLNGKLTNQERAIAYSNRGNGWCSKGKFDLAIRDDNEAIRLDPKLASAYSNRSAAESNIGENDRAIEDASVAISLAPKFAINFILRASAWFIKGEHDRALADSNEAIRLAPNSGNGYVLRGNIWRQKGNLERALADQGMAIQLGAKDSADKPIYYVERGDTLRYKGDLDLAFADYDQALGFAPGFIAALVGQGLTYEKRGDLGKARISFQSAIESQDTLRAGIAGVALTTARARIAALDSGAAQPLIPAAPSKVTSATSIPTPILTVQTVASVDKLQGRRIALVIGNSAYKNVSFLPNPQHDAKAIEISLRAIGFETVTLLIDGTREGLSDALSKFANESEKADWAMVYYAGHGMEVNGINYLIPVDAKLASDRDVQFEAVPLNQVMGSVSGAKKIALILLDACRANPFLPQMQRSAAPDAVTKKMISAEGGTIGTRGFQRGLAEVKVPGAMLLVYAARQGEVALDGEGPDSPFAIAVVQRLATPGVEVNKLFRLVRDDVMEATAGRQEPYTYGSLPGNEDFFFVAKK